VSGEEVEHPLTKLYIHCSRLRSRVQSEKVQAEMDLARVERELDVLKRKLAKEYGVGYITIKWVKGKSGRKYHYAIYRVVVPKRKDVYLGKDVLELVLKARGLRKRLRGLRKAEYMLGLHLKALEHYAPRRAPRPKRYRSRAW